MGTAALPVCALPMFFKPHLEKDLCAKICKSGFSMPTWWSAFLPLFPSRVTIMVLLFITWTRVPVKTKQSHKAILYGFSISHCPTSNCATEILSTGHVKSCIKTRGKGLGMVVICLNLRNQGNKNIWLNKEKRMRIGFQSEERQHLKKSSCLLIDVRGSLLHHFRSVIIWKGIKKNVFTVNHNKMYWTLWDSKQSC